MRDVIQIIRHLRLEGHGSSLLAKGLGIALRAVIEETGEASPSLRRRLLIRLLKLLGRS